MPSDEHSALTLRLRDAAERCVVLLGSGLLRGHAGREYLELLGNDRDRWVEYFGQLRVQLLQIIAWIIGERRGAVPMGDPVGVAAYNEFYSVEQLSKLAHAKVSDARAETWRRLQRVMAGLWCTDESIGVTGWGSDLFDPVHTTIIRGLCLSEADTEALLVGVLGLLLDSSSRADDADNQLLGDIHEWLMERQLVVDSASCSVRLEDCSGHERRTTGSYFTPAQLVEHLLDVCLEPVLDARTNREHPEVSIAELLGLRIVDPACGTGVFLIAAARRVARRIDSLACALPTQSDGQGSLRDVICHCLYGVDIGSTTVALCRLVLWFSCGEPYRPLPTLGEHIRCGNSTLGAWPGFDSAGVPDVAFEASDGDDVDHARALRLRNRAERRRASHADAGSAPESVVRTPEHSRFLADLWCAIYVWPKRTDADVPTHTDFELACRAPEKARSRWGHSLQGIVERHMFFHWWLEFADVFRVNGTVGQAPSTAAGFDLVLGNPPWVAYAGRSTQPLHAGIKRFFGATYEAFAGFPTTHGIFIELATRLVGARGRIGLIVPASVADLAGYAPTRRAHDRRCRPLCPLPDFGEGRFTGVTQPCVALVSERTNMPTITAAPGAPWELDRSDLDQVGRGLLARIVRSERFPEELFGERGFQSTPLLRRFIRQGDEAEGEFSLGLREGSDIREFQLGPVRHYADPVLLGRGLRPLAEFQKVALVVRQTARYPIVAKSDGQAFRNSLLAVLHSAQWPWASMLCLLNSALFRWCHYFRFRDGRQPILPQLKIGHLRALPAPADRGAAEFAILEALGSQLAVRNQGVLETERVILDECVSRLYGLSEPEHRLVTEWHAQRPR